MAKTKAEARTLEAMAEAKGTIVVSSRILEVIGGAYQGFGSDQPPKSRPKGGSYSVLTQRTKRVPASHKYKTVAPPKLEDKACTRELHH